MQDSVILQERMVAVAVYLQDERNLWLLAHVHPVTGALQLRFDPALLSAALVLLVLYEALTATRCQHGRAVQALA